MYKLLVADDENWIRKGIVRMIDCEKHQIEAVFEASSVKQAVEIFDREHPDIVLVDVKPEDCRVQRPKQKGLRLF